MVKKKKSLGFSVGDWAVYPAHGVGKIEAIETKTVLGSKTKFLIMNILDTGMNVLVPITNVENVGLRHLIKSSQVNEIYKVLKEKKKVATNATWNRRYREYMEKIKTGSVIEIAEVLRDLIILKSSKDLSFGERKMLDTAKNLLIKEIAIAKNVTENKIEKEMNKIFESRS
jgi:CarD family transcriptional regulator